MTAHTWPPGTVARVNGAMAVRADGGRGWYTRAGRLSDANVAYVYPRVVLDPEDREQVERLYRALCANVPPIVALGIGDPPDAEYVARKWVEGAQAALREFASPVVKPEEPTGWLAAVVDDVGDRWVRDGMPGDRSQSGHWWNHTVAAEKNYDGLLRADWHAINAVKVLSDGIPA